MTATKENPYIGPQPFQESERERFFGREHEANELLALAVSEQEIVFYAQSGAGKSSLVNTCLIPDLKKKGFEVLLGRVGGDAPAGLAVDDTFNIFVFNLLRRLSTREVDLNSLTGLSLSKFLVPWAEDETDSATHVSNRRALIVDQFEEIFSTHPEAWERRREFFEQLAEALESDPRLRVILVMREDFIASLDPYANLMPSRLRMRYYMQRLEHAAALLAVKEPVKGKDFSRPYDAGAAEKLVDDLRTIKVINPDGTSDIGMGQFVEPLYLQVICYELWNNLPEGGKTITRKNVEDVGDVGTSLGNYFGRRVATVAAAENVKEGKIRKWFTEELISSTGIRNMVLEEPGETSANLENRVIRALSDLVRAEQRGGGAVFYELTHDRLVEPIMASNHKWFDEHLSQLQKQAALWEGDGRKDSWLLTDQALVEVEEWAKQHADELTDSEREFLEVCQSKQAEKKAIQEREAERKELDATKKLMDEQAHSAQIARRFSIVAGVLMLIAIIASLLAVSQANEAKQQQAIAETQESVALAEQAKAKQAEADAKEQANVALSGQLSAFALNKLSSQPDLAILLGLAADKLHSDINSRNVLLTMQQENAAVKSFLSLEIPPDEVQFGPDGTIVVSRDENGVTIWDANSLEKLNDKPFKDHYSGVTAWALSQDGALMASGGADGTIVIWDALQRKKLSEPFKAHKNAVSRLAFNPAGTKLASAGWNENSIILWDITDRARPQDLDEPLLGHPGVVTSLAFSPDDATLASGSNDSSIILWDVETRKPIGETLAGHAEAIYGVAFTTDGKTLVSGSYDDTVILWDVSDLTEPRPIGDPLTGPGIDIEIIAISPDDKTVASGDDYGNIYLWDISDRENVKPMEKSLNGGTSWVVSLAFSSDSKTLASGSLDGKVILWDLVEQTKIGETLSAHKNAVRGVALQPESQTLITASEDSFITFWDIADLQHPKPDPDSGSLQGHLGSPTGIRFSADGSLLASLGYEGTIFFNVASQEKLGYGDFLPARANDDIFAYQITQSGRITVYVKEIASGDVSMIPVPGTNPMLSPNGETLAYQTGGTESESAQLHLWDITANKLLPDLISGVNPVFSSDGQVLAYYTRDPETGEDRINLWEIARSELLGEPVAGTFLGISSDKQMLTYTTVDPDTGGSLIHQWDITNARPQGESISASNYSISENGEVLVVQSVDQSTQVSSIKIFNMATGEVLANSSREGEFVALNSDGRFLFYRTYGRSGNEDNVAFVNLVDTGLGNDVGDPIKGGLALNNDNTTPRVFQAGPVLVFEVQDANTQLALIDTSNSRRIDVIDEAFYQGQTSDGGTLVYQAGNEIKLLDTTTHLTTGQAIKGDYLGISPDGKTLASHNGSGLITFWDLARSWPLGTPVQNVPEEVSHAVLSQDGSTLAWIDKGGLMVMSGTTRAGPYSDHQTGTLSGAYPAFSLNGGLLAVGDYDPPITTLWDLKTGNQTENEFSCCWPALSPDGRLLATGDFNTETTTVWDVDTGEPVWDALPGVFPAFSPDGKQLAIGNRNTTIIAFWDVNTRELLGVELPGVFPAFSPDGKLVAVGDWNPSTTTIWDVTTLQPVGAEIPGVLPAFSSDGKILAVGSYGTEGTILWDMDTHEQVGDEISGYNFPAFSPDGRVLAVGSENSHTTAVWGLDANTMPMEQANEFHALPEDFVLSSDGKYIASILPDDVVIRDLNADNSLHLDFGEYTGKLNGPISFYSDDSRFAAIGDDGTLLTWDVDSGELTIPDEESQPPQLQAGTIKAFNLTGAYLAYVYGETNINIWDLRNGKLHSSLGGIEIEKLVGALAFSADGRWLAYSDGPGIRLWDIKSEKLTEDVLLTGAVAINQLSLITEGDEVTYVVSTDESNATQIWDWKSRTKIGNPMQDIRIVGLDTGNRFAFYLDRDHHLVRWQWGSDLTQLLCPLVKRNFTLEEWTRYFPGKEYPKDNLTCPDYPAGQ